MINGDVTKEKCFEKKRIVRFVCLLCFICFKCLLAMVENALEGFRLLCGVQFDYYM
jgi:hypothetical protein